ncbi:MAG: hypothetical protein QNJ56_02100 [Gammaproteobacteria bacterium]|nr:hypothetical protein [Gammaproteobacteria bacterium]
MNYTITWGDKTVRVDYFGEINNKDIESAHYSLNGDERFYECKSLILDISKCNMDKVFVDDLITIIGTDLGASETIKSLKVAMIAVEEQNKHKASRYISKCRNFGYPWDFELFESSYAAQAWLDS